MKSTGYKYLNKYKTLLVVNKSANNKDSKEDFFYKSKGKECSKKNQVSHVQLQKSN